MPSGKNIMHSTRMAPKSRTSIFSKARRNSGSTVTKNAPKMAPGTLTMPPSTTMTMSSTENMKPKDDGAMKVR